MPSCIHWHLSKFMLPLVSTGCYLRSEVVASECGILPTPGSCILLNKKGIGHWKSCKTWIKKNLPLCMCRVTKLTCRWPKVGERVQECFVGKWYLSWDLKGKSKQKGYEELLGWSICQVPQWERAWSLWGPQVFKAKKWLNVRLVKYAEAILYGPLQAMIRRMGFSLKNAMGNLGEFKAGKWHLI